MTFADITPKSVYLDRRKFLQVVGIVSAAAAAGKGILKLALPAQPVFAATKLTGLVKNPSARPKRKARSTT